MQRRRFFTTLDNVRPRNKEGGGGKGQICSSPSTSTLGMSVFPLDPPRLEDLFSESLEFFDLIEILVPLALTDDRASGRSIRGEEGPDWVVGPVDIAVLDLDSVWSVSAIGADGTAWSVCSICAVISGDNVWGVTASAA